MITLIINCKEAPMFLRMLDCPKFEEHNRESAEVPHGTPFLHKAVKQNFEVAVEELLRRKIVDVNAVDSQGCTAFALAIGKPRLVKMFCETDNVSPVATVANAWGPFNLALRSNKSEDILAIFSSEKWPHGHGQKLHAEVSSILDYYPRDAMAPILATYWLLPQTAHMQCRMARGEKSVIAAVNFCLLVLIGSELVKPKQLPTPALRSNFTTRQLIRFFNIASKLPMELQMTLCNYAQGLPKSSIPSKLTDPAFYVANDLVSRT